MGEFVDDIRAALVMNPNFCRLRYKKEELSKKNGFVKKEEGAPVKNTVICNNVSVEDSNGNVCLQMKDFNSNRKVTFKEETKRQTLRRRASDIEIREVKKINSRKQNCAKCSPAVHNNKYDALSKRPNNVEGVKRDALLHIDPLLRPSYGDSHQEEMFIDGDSKYSSETPSKESFCDVQVQVSDTCLDVSLKEPVETESSDTSFNHMISLDDILARYSYILDENSLQMLQNTQTNKRKRKGKHFKFLCFVPFILTPMMLFYFLVFLYFFQPEPIYSILLKHLKLKDETQLTPLCSLIEYLKCISSGLALFAYEKFEELVTNFN